MIAYFTVPSALMKTLNVLQILSHARSKILSYGVADAPAGAWAAQRVMSAMEFERAPVLLLRDRAGEYGEMNAPGSARRSSPPLRAAGWLIESNSRTHD